MPSASSQDEQMISRRRALALLALFPASLLDAKPNEYAPSPQVEEFLRQCTIGIAACWQLLNGQGLAEVEYALPCYLPALAGQAKHSLKHQRALARLASQGYKIAAIVAGNRNDLKARAWNCQQAHFYARLTEDRDLEVSALIGLATTHYYQNHPTQMLETYQEALPYVHDASPRLRGRVYIGLGHGYAACGQQQQALRYLGLAHEQFPDYLADQTSTLYTDTTMFGLYLWEGVALRDLHQPEESWQALALLGGRQAGSSTSQRVQLEIVNHQAETAIALKDLDVFCECIQRGVKGATALGSQKRYLETRTAYAHGSQLWPNEPRVKELLDLFVPGIG